MAAAPNEPASPLPTTGDGSYSGRTEVGHAASAERETPSSAQPMRGRVRKNRKEHRILEPPSRPRRARLSRPPACPFRAKRRARGRPRAPPPDPLGARKGPPGRHGGTFWAASMPVIRRVRRGTSVHEECPVAAFEGKVIGDRFDYPPALHGTSRPSPLRVRTASETLKRTHRRLGRVWECALTSAAATSRCFPGCVFEQLQMTFPARDHPRRRPDPSRQSRRRRRSSAPRAFRRQAWSTRRAPSAGGRARSQRPSAASRTASRRRRSASPRGRTYTR
jgi:hypothetical protein